MDAIQNVKKRIPVFIISSFIFLKNDESDSSESSENEEDENICLNDMQTLFAILMVNKSRGEHNPVEKIIDYVDRVIPNYTEIVFKEHFR